MCIPYAIAVNNNATDLKSNNKYQNLDYPLGINISNDNRSIKIRIDNIEKIRRKEELNVTKEYNKFHNNHNPHSEQEINDYNHFTEIVVYLPNIAINYFEINNLLEKYVILNTHIDFRIQVGRKKYQQQEQPQHLYQYPATQKLKNDWKNKESIYSYTLAEIKDYFHGIDKSYDNLNVYDEFIYKVFREGTTLPKDEVLKKLTFSDLRYDDEKIEYIFQKMKDKTKPIKNQSSSLPKLDLPFDIKMREEALKNRLKQVYEIEDDSFVYKRVDKYYENPNGIQYPFKVEFILAKSSILDNEKLLTLIESVNLSPSLHVDSLFTSNDWIFNLKKIRTKDILTILSHCGYSIYNEDKHKKPYNILIVNLLSPRIDYNSHNKSNINLEPFAEVFANDFYKFCKSPPPSSSLIYRKNNGGNVNDTTNIGQLRILLRERLNSVSKNPELKKTDRWTQSTVYYILRKRLIDQGIPVKTREYLTGEIKNECERLGEEVRGKGFKRHELGIIAAERAQLYFDGQAFGIGFDQQEELMKKGTDLLVIEKEGIADILADFADERGIAILNSRGFLTEYASELSDLAEKNGCNIAVLTDLDSSGLLISSNLANAHRIGIDFETLEYFGLSEEEVQETVGGKKDSHLPTLKTLSSSKIPRPYSKSEWQELINFLDTGMRIEIDSVRAQINNNEEFWNYIIEQLEIVFPRRDYNRSVKVPDCVLPTLFEQLKENVNSIVSEVQTPEQQKIIKQLANVEGFYYVKPKEKEIEERLRSLVETEGVKKKIIEVFNKKFSSSQQQKQQQQQQQDKAS